MKQELQAIWSAGWDGYKLARPSPHQVGTLQAMVFNQGFKAAMEAEYWEMYVAIGTKPARLA